MKEIYKDSTYTPEERAHDLLNRMSVEERAAQLLSIPAIEAEIGQEGVHIKGIGESIK